MPSKKAPPPLRPARPAAPRARQPAPAELTDPPEQPETPGRPDSRQLQTAAPAPAPPPSPARLRHDALNRQIAQALQELAACQAALATFWADRARVLTPLQVAFRAARRAHALALDAQFGRPGWSRREQAALQSLIIARCNELLEENPADDGIKQLFDRHSDIAYDHLQDEERAALEALRKHMEAGRDDGDFLRGGSDDGSDDSDSEDDRADGPGRNSFARDSAASGSAASAGAARPPGRPSAAERRRDQQAAIENQSVRDLYRKLVSALHPDRETDPARRAVKTALMQQANQAYEAGDLSALLDLQRRAGIDDVTATGPTAAQRLKHYNRVLSQRLADLKAELEDAERSLGFGLGVYIRRSRWAEQLPALINEAARELKALLAQQQEELRQLADQTATRRWLQATRPLRRAPTRSRRWG